MEISTPNDRAYPIILVSVGVQSNLDLAVHPESPQLKRCLLKRNSKWHTEIALRPCNDIQCVLREHHLKHKANASQQ